MDRRRAARARYRTFDRLNRYAVAEMLAGHHLARVDEQLDRAIRVQEREAQEQRIERHVAAPR